MKGNLKLVILFLSYTLFLSLGLAFFWELFGFALVFAVDGYYFIRQYPRYLPFCVIGELIAFIGFLIVVSINMKISKKIDLSKRKWITFSIAIFLISIFIAKWWLDFFWFLQCKF